MTRIDLSRVQSVYSGKAWKCCCGCAGKHTYASRFADQGVLVRGYALSANEVSDRTVRLIVGKMERVTDPNLFEVGQNNVCVTVGDRWYIAYGENDAPITAEYAAELTAQ